MFWQNNRYLLLIFLFCFTHSFSQVVFNEDFEGGIQVNTSLPSGWSESGLSKDGMFQVGDSASASYSLNGDILFYFPNHSKFAFTNDVSCSYNLGGTSCNKSADRLILPKQTFSNSSNSLVLSFDCFFSGKLGVTADVEYSLNGTSWIKLASISPSIYWNTQDVDISVLKNQSNVLIAFRFNDNNALRDGLAIDNVSISYKKPWVDLLVVSSELTRYTKIPSTQLVPLPLNCIITNKGSKTSDSSNFNLNIYSIDNSVKNKIKSFSRKLANIASKDSLTIDFGTIYSNELTDSFEFEFEILDKIDTISLNNILYFNTDVTLDEYARDDGTASSVLGITSSNTITLGNMFEMKRAAYIDSVSVLIDKKNMIDGSNIQAAIYPVLDGVPLSNPIGYSSIISISSLDTNSKVIFKITDNFLSRLKLDTGNYLVAINKFTNGSSLAVKMSNRYFTQNAVYVKIGNANFQTLDTYYSGAYKLVPTIRMFCSPYCNLSAIIQEGKADCSTSKGSLTVVPKNGSYPYLYTWSTNEKDSILKNILVGKYAVSIIDKFGCQFDTNKINLSYASSPQITIDSIFHPTCYGLNNGYISMKVIDENQLTKIFWNEEQTNTLFHDKLLAGQYNVKVYNSMNCFDSTLVEITSPDSLSVSYSSANETSSVKGEIYLFVTGGTGPYTYYWNDSVTTKNRLGLSGDTTYSVIVTDKNNCNKSVSVEIRKVLGVDQFSDRNLISFFPNPSSAILNINVNETYRVQLISSSGQIIESINLELGLNKIDVENFEKGIYLLRFENNNQVFLKKITII
jgi:hypothetical protein